MPAIQMRLLPFMLLSHLTLTACLSTERTSIEQAVSRVPQPSSDHYIPVQRYGRYTLVELAPHVAQQNLLLQVIDIDLPGNWSISVADALRYVLLRSGYRLCDRTPENAALFALPLPAPHLKLGPVQLRDALQTLAGPAWALQTDDQLRLVCFIPVAGAAKPSPTAQAAVNPEVTQ